MRTSKMEIKVNMRIETERISHPQKMRSMVDTLYFVQQHAPDASIFSGRVRYSTVQRFSSDKNSLSSRRRERHRACL